MYIYIHSTKFNSKKNSRIVLSKLLHISIRYLYESNVSNISKKFTLKNERIKKLRNKYEFLFKTHIRAKISVCLKQTTKIIHYK